MKKMAHLRLPESCIWSMSIMDLQYYQIQTLEVRDAIHSYQLSATGERSSFLLRDVPHVLILYLDCKS